MLKILVLITNIIVIIMLVYYCVKKCKHVSDEEKVDSEGTDVADDIELAGTQHERRVSKDYQNDIYSIYVPSVPQGLLDVDVSPSG